GRPGARGQVGLPQPARAVSAGAPGRSRCWRIAERTSPTGFVLVGPAVAVGMVLVQRSPSDMGMSPSRHPEFFSCALSCASYAQEEGGVRMRACKATGIGHQAFRSTRLFLLINRSQAGQARFLVPLASPVID